MDSIYVINLPNKEYIDFINDLIRMTTIQIVIQFLFYINNPNQMKFFTIEFILLLLYVILGVCFYWLVIKKLIIFK